MTPSPPPVARQDAVARTEALLREYAGWPPPGEPVSGAGGALVHAFAHLVDVVCDRIDRVPEKNLLAFLELIGARPAPPQPARAPLTFTLAAGATADVALPARTRAAAAIAPGESEPPVFETERDLVVTAAVLESVWTREPGRDCVADHGTGARPLKVFSAATPIDHWLYVGHDGLFGLAEAAELRFRFELPASGAKWPWALHWEYWDGMAWAPLAAQVNAIAAATVETTLAAVPAIPRSTVNGRPSRWLRARLGTTVPRLGGAADRAADVLRSELAPDALRANGAPVGPERPFAPFVTDKQLLVRCDEAFSKPGATVSVRIGLDPAKPAEPSSDLRLGWQWWSGQWNALGESTPTGSSGVTDGTLGLRRDGSVGFDVPIGWSAGPDGGLWLLVEVLQGGYGSAPPAIALLDLAYDWSRPRLRAPTLRAEVDRSGRRLDQAFTNVVEVDLTKDFAPFGLRPTIGDTLYLACDDAFSPPRDSVELDVELTSPAAASEPPPAAAGPQLTLRWEYYDTQADAWTALGESGPGAASGTPWSLTDGTQAFTKPATITFKPLATMGTVAVNGVTRRWLRIRIARGDYGRDAALKPPWVASISLSYHFTSTPQAPESLVVENDFVRAELVPDDTGVLEPYTPPTDAAPTLYLGFDRPFSNQAMALYFAVRDAAPDTPPPSVVWEFWDGAAGDWSRLETRDETVAFTRRALVTFVGPPSLAGSEQFGLQAHWLRARWSQGRYRRSPALERVATNTTWGLHQTTIDGEVLGSSTGSRSQVFRASRTPVLEGQVLEVREDGAGGDWVPWVEVRDLHESAPADRHYVLDRGSGDVRFGDGVHGRIPPRGRDNVRLAAYRTGGGEAGNRPAGAIARLLSTVPYVDSVVNLEAAAGGISAEQPAALIERGPRMLRHRDRAVVPGDFEDLAREASPEVARAMVVPTPRAGPGGRVGVIVLARGGLRPTPSTELIDRVDQYLRRRSPATFDLWVAGPGWLRVDVDAELVPVSLELATDVDNAVRGRLRAFLHPLTGGPDGDGWPLGRRVFRSDVQAIVEATTGVDHVRVLTLAEHVTAASPVAGAFLVYSGEHRVRVVGGD